MPRDDSITPLNVLDKGEKNLSLVVPDAAASVISELGVPAVPASRGAPLAMVPHLLWDCRHQ